MNAAPRGTRQSLDIGSLGLIGIRANERTITRRTVKCNDLTDCQRPFHRYRYRPSSHSDSTNTSASMERPYIGFMFACGRTVSLWPFSFFEFKSTLTHLSWVQMPCGPYHTMLCSARQHFALLLLLATRTIHQIIQVGCLPPY